MASVTKTPSGTWKALVRKRGYVAEIKTLHTKRDADDWARGVEDEMVRGMYIRRSNAERLTVSAALDRYVREVAPTKKASTQDREKGRYETLRAFFGDYSLVAVTPELVAKFRDKRLEVGLASNTVRLDLARAVPDPLTSSRSVWSSRGRSSFEPRSSGSKRWRCVPPCRSRSASTAAERSFRMRNSRWSERQPLATCSFADSSRAYRCADQAAREKWP
jgi:hypothetical protein